MNANYAGLIEDFRRLEVLVIGEAMLDVYLEGSAGRICREAPVPIVDVVSRVNAAGGAANTALNIAALGARASLLSVTGDDPEHELIRVGLERHGVDTDHVLAISERKTLAKHRVVADSQLLVRFDEGSTSTIDPDVEQVVIDRLRRLFAAADAVIVSDYGYGVLTPAVLRELASLQAQTPRVLVVDSRELERYRIARPSVVKPNYEEAVRLLGAGRVEGSDARAKQMAEHAERLLDLTGAQCLAITLDADGAIMFERGNEAYRTYARPARNARAAGAGDTFVSALALALAAGAGATAAAELASAAAAVVVAKDGTSTCSERELHEHVSSTNKIISEGHRLEGRAAFYREQGRRIIFTNGCFDILHRGHVTYLNRAKALGDILIVGVNSDASVARLKGDGRPINSLDDRIQVLSALSCIDHIVPFEEDTPVELIRAIRPDVFVKGGDYSRDNLPEAPIVEELGGTVQLLPYLEERSTTGMIEKIREVEASRDGSERRDGRPHRRKPSLGARREASLR